MILHALHRDRPTSWVYVPQLLERVERFCRERQTDTDPGTLRKAIMQDFTADNPQMLVLIAIEGSEIKGHLLAVMCSWFGRKFSLAMQIECDRHVGDGIMTAGWEQLKDWTTAQGGRKIKCEALTPALARLYRRFGLRNKRITLEVEV